MDKKNHTEPAKTGFDAISGAARALYPGQEGVYYGTLIPYTLGGGDPLDGVEIWKRAGRPALALYYLRLYRAV